MLEISLAEIEASLPIRFVLCSETDMLLIKKEKNMTKVKVNNNIYYYEVSSKTNFEIIGITVSMQKLT